MKRDNKETSLQANIKNQIEEEIEDWECKQQEDAIQEVNLNYNKIPKSRKDSLIQRIGWKTKYTI